VYVDLCKHYKEELFFFRAKLVEGNLTLTQASRNRGKFEIGPDPPGDEGPQPPERMA